MPGSRRPTVARSVPSRGIQPKPLPDAAALLAAARACLRERLAIQFPGISQAPSFRHLDSILRELLHRAGGNLDALHDQQLASGLGLVQELNTLLARSSASQPRRSRRLRSTKTQVARERRTTFSEVLADLSDGSRRLWTQALRNDPPLHRAAVRLTRRISAWEARLACKLASDPPVIACRRQQHGSDETLDGEGLQLYLRSRPEMPSDLVVLEGHKASGGFSKATWLFKTRSNRWGERQFVLRQSLPGKRFERILAALPQEFPLLRVLHAEGIPVPQTILLARAPNPIHEDFLLMERAAGRVVGNATAVGTPLQPPVLQSVASALARLHSIQWERHRTALRKSATWHRNARYALADAARDSIDRWERFSNTRLAVISPALQASFGWLKANIPGYQGAPSIVHGDFGFHNILIDGDRLSAILDWEAAHLGAPAQDLASLKPTVEKLMPWDLFVEWYVAAGGRPVSESEILYFQVFRSVSLTVAGHVARGKGFSDFASERPELTEVGLGFFPVFLGELVAAFRAVEASGHTHDVPGMGRARIRPTAFPARHARS